MCREHQVVLSLSGRDEGTLLAVVSVDDNGVLLADGKHRPLERPKRKNPRHIRPLDIEFGREAMTTNRALRKALRDCSERLNANDV